MGFIIYYCMCVFGHSIAQPGSASDCGLQQWPDRAPATYPKVPVKALKGGAQVHNLYVERHSSPGRVVVLIYNSTLNTLFFIRNYVSGGKPNLQDLFKIHCKCCNKSRYTSL